MKTKVNTIPVIAPLNNSSSKLFELVDQLNKSTILNYGNDFLLIGGLNDSSSNLFELVN